MNLDLEGNGCGPTWYIPAETEDDHENTVRIAGAPAEIHTDHFLPNPFQFIIHRPSYRSTPYSMRCWHCPKVNHKENKTTVDWDVTLCSLEDRSLPSYFHLQDKRMPLLPRRRQMVVLKCWYLSIKLHDHTPHKISFYPKNGRNRFLRNTAIRLLNYMTSHHYPSTWRYSSTVKTETAHPFYTWYLSPNVQGFTSHITFFHLKMDVASSSETQLFMELHGITFQKTVIFILPNVRTSNLK
jgi:hypothetical protein